MIDPVLLKKKDKILEMRKRVKNYGRAGRENFERDWYLNINLYAGRHWIKYDYAARTWNDIIFTADWKPRPVTNKYASAGNTITSVLIQKEPRTIVKPEDADNDADVASAEIGEAMVDVVGREAGLKDARRIAAPWLVHTGNVFFHQYYELSAENGKIFIDFERCEDCLKVWTPDTVESGHCPICGIMDNEDGTKKGKLVKAVDHFGIPMGRWFPKGKVTCDAVPPFEIFLNQEIEDYRKQREVVRSKRVPIGQLESYYPALKDKIQKTGDSEDSSQFYMRDLAYASKGGDAGNPGGGGDSAPSAVVDYLYCLPSADFPNGLQATLIKDEVAELSELEDLGPVDESGKPIPGKEARIIPIVFCGAEKVPGRIWCKTKLDDLAQKQIHRNKIEALIDLAVRRMASPHWLIPTTANMPVKPTGEPGQTLEFTPGPRGLAPTKVDGANLPEFVFKYLSLIDQAFEELAKTYDVLKGEQPAQMPFASLKFLSEKAYSGHFEMIMSWEQANTEVVRQLIMIARKHFIEPRKNTLRTDNGSWETRQFLRADFQGNVDIETEAGSTVPKSQAAEQAGILESVKFGMIDVSNPRTKHKVLQRMGQADLGDEYDVDVQDASREWNAFMESVHNNPADQSKWVTRHRKGIDNESMHYIDASARAKSEEFWELPEPARKLWEEHVAVHRASMDAEIQAAAMRAATPAPRPGAGGTMTRLEREAALVGA